MIESAIGAAVVACPDLQFGEPCGGMSPGFHGEFLCIDEVVTEQDAALHLIVVEFVEQVFDLSFTDGQSEVICGDGFDGVGFVEDDGFVIGQDAATIAAECEVREEESVIDDEQVGVPDAASCGVVEAVGVSGAFFAEAVTVIAEDFVPDIDGGLEWQVGAAAIAGFRGPLANAGECLLSGWFEHGFLVGSLDGFFKSTEADVVTASFDEYGGEFDGEDGLQEGDIVVDQLFLQADGVS